MKGNVVSRASTVEACLVAVFPSRMVGELVGSVAGSHAAVTVIRSATEGHHVRAYVELSHWCRAYSVTRRTATVAAYKAVAQSSAPMGQSVGAGAMMAVVS